MFYFRKQPPQSLPLRVAFTPRSLINSILWNSQNRIVTVGTGTNMSTGARMWFSSAALRNVECTVPRTRMHLLIAQHHAIHLNAYLHMSSHSFLSVNFNSTSQPSAWVYSLLSISFLVCFDHHGNTTSMLHASSFLSDHLIERFV